ncbi:MAG: sigma-70 family RNA polymerase sigma factor [Brevinematales bacterium]
MSYSELNENEIIGRMKDLMQSAGLHDDVVRQYFQEIYERFYSQCYNIARYYGLKRSDAEDAVQESFIKFFTNFNSFHIDRPFKPWIFKIVLNCVRDRYRDLIKHAYSDIESAGQIKNDNQEILLDEFHMRDVFHSIIIRLPEKLRTAVIIRNYGGLDMQATADMLRISLRQAHNRLEAAYALIKEGLNNEI